MHSYTAYGLSIQSDIDLSTLPRGSSSCDVRVRRGTVTVPPEADASVTWTTSRDIYFRFQGFGTVQVSLGTEIVVDADGVDDRTVGMFVLGPAMGVLLHQRGLLVLHASAVIVNGGVVAFLGHSGWGKSTMAAAIVKLGNLAFCDDLVAIALGDGVPMAFPGYPFLKLGLDSGEILGYKSHDTPAIMFGDERRKVAVQGPDPRLSAPLARVYVLAEGDRPEVEFLKPQEAAIELVRHSYALSCLEASGMSRLHLKSCAELVQSVPICRIRRPRRLDMIHEVAELILQSTGQCAEESANDS